MPFDVGERATLEDRLMGLGVLPVPMAQLEAHKAEQVRLHPPSFWAKPISFVLTWGVGFAGTVGVAAAVDWVDWLTVLGAAFIGVQTLCLSRLVLNLLEVTVLGLAEWQERKVCRAFVECYGSVPRPIRDVAVEALDRLARRGQAARFIYGELFQNEINLDPYILIEVDGERVCLGVWERRRVIAKAELID